MKIEIAAKNYSVPARLNGLIEKKAGRLNKYLEPDARVKFFCRVERDSHSMEITVYNGRDVIRAEVCSLNMYDNLDETLKKIERQIVKRLTKIDNKAKKGYSKEMEFLFNSDIPIDESPKSVVREKTYELKPMSTEAAIDALEMLDHTFYVFQNEKTKQVNVLYKRHDGDYGVIEAIV